MSQRRQLTRFLAELKRRGVLQVAAAYGAGAFVAMEAADLILPRIGLGEGAVTLVVWAAIAGFPVAIAVSWFFELRGDGIAATPPSTLEELDAIATEPARRRWPLGVLALVGTVLLLAGAWLGLRDGPGPGTGTLPEAGDQMLAVLPFSVHARPDFDYLGTGLVDLLTTRIDGTGQLKAVPVRAVMGLVGQEPGTELASEAARRIAGTLAAGRYVEGTVFEAGGRLSISGSLIETSTGRELAAATVEGTESELFRMVDDMTMALVADLSGTPGGRLTQIAALTTDSLPALRAYLRGQRLLRNGQFTAALAAFEEASAIDTAFALAYYRESVAREWGTQRGATEAVERAATFVDRLSDRDRQLVLAMRAWRRGDARTAEDMYRTVLGIWPDDVESWLQLAEVLNHAGPLRGEPLSASREPFERVLRYEPDHLLSLWHLARIDVVEGRMDSAADKVRRIEALSPEGDRTLELRAMLAARSDSVAWRTVMDRLRGAQDITVRAASWNVAVYAGALDRAAEAAEAMTAPARGREVRATGHLMQAIYALSKGREASAEASMERVAALDPGLALSYGAAFDLLPFAVADPAALETRRRELLAWTPPDGCVSRHPVRTYEPATCIRPMVREYLLALVEVHLGMADSVDTRIATFRRHLAEGVNGRHARQFLSEIEAERAWLAGDAREAARVWDADPNHVWYVEALQSLFYSHGRGRFRRAQSLEAVGRLEEAARWYGSFDDVSDLDLVYLAPGSVARGRVLEALDQPVEAAAAYRRAADLLSGADGAWAILAEAAAEGLGRTAP